jgi:hypothetical protein
MRKLQLMKVIGATLLTISAAPLHLNAGRRVLVTACNAMTTRDSTTVGVLCLLGGYALAPADDDYISTSQLAGLIAFLVTVPLGASIGHARIGGVQRH